MTNKTSVIQKSKKAIPLKLKCFFCPANAKYGFLPANMIEDKILRKFVIYIYATLEMKCPWNLLK